MTLVTAGEDTETCTGTEQVVTRGGFNGSRGGAGLRVGRSCVHVHVHLHLVVQDLHKLLHGWQVTRLQFGPHGHIWGDRGRVRLSGSDSQRPPGIQEPPGASTSPQEPPGAPGSLVPWCRTHR